MTPWKILVVDDEEGIHGITRMIFRDYEFEQRTIELISAMNGTEAKALLQQHDDIALVLLDVVMETENEGLQLVDHIRNDLNNPDVRIILRTGHPGYAPEAQVIINYDINDYLSKAELSASRLLTSVVVALRSYRDIQTARLAPFEEIPSEDDTEELLLTAAAEQLKQQITPILQQTQRLQQLDLNPIAKDLVTNLHAQHQRLDNSIQLVTAPSNSPSNQHPSASTLEANLILEPVQLLNEVLQIFLPQSRREGWLLDYSLDSHLPKEIALNPGQLRQLAITAIELALLQANGNDLKLSLQLNAKQRLLNLSVQQSNGQPVFDLSPWAQHLRQQLKLQCQRLNGQLIEIDEGGVICCQVQQT